MVIEPEPRSIVLPSSKTAVHIETVICTGGCFCAIPADQVDTHAAWHETRRTKAASNA